MPAFRVSVMRRAGHRTHQRIARESALGIEIGCCVRSSVDEESTRGLRRRRRRGRSYAAGLGIDTSAISPKALTDRSPEATRSPPRPRVGGRRAVFLEVTPVAGRPAERGARCARRRVLEIVRGAPAHGSWLLGASAELRSERLDGRELTLLDELAFRERARPRAFVGDGERLCRFGRECALRLTDQYELGLRWRRDSAMSSMVTRARQEADAAGRALRLRARQE